MRRVILATLADGPVLCEPSDRDERRVEDRDREHEQWQEDRGHCRPGRRPACREPECGEQEAEHLAPRVSHEDEGVTARAKVEGQESAAGEPEREREHEHEVVRVDGNGVDREVRAGDRGEGGGQAVHVVEEVEGVRDPDEPDDCDRGGDNVVRKQLHAQTTCHGDTGGRELRR